MKQLLKFSLVAVFLATCFFSLPSTVHASNTSITIASNVPREYYDWNTNPYSSSEDAIWIAPHGNAKLIGPYYGGYEVGSQRGYTISWSGSGYNTVPYIVILDGTTGHVLAEAVGTPGQTGTVHMSLPSSAKSVNIFVYNNQYSTVGYWNFNIKSY